MICYRDMMFCNAKDCANLDCRRNTKNINLPPDDFWADKICIGDIKDKCKNYKKEQSK